MDPHARSGLLAPAETDPSALADHVLLVHWGRRNAGPLMLAEYARALQPLLGERLHVSGNPAVEPSVRPPATVASFDVTTYRSGVGAVLGLPRLLVSALRLRRYLRRQRVGAVLAPMWSLWQTIALPLWLPRGVRYVTTVHDATTHPGMRNPVIDLCRRAELRRADAVVVYSAGVQAAVAAVVPPSVPVVRLELGAPPVVPAPRANEVPVVGFFGRLLAYKGIDQYVDAIRLIAAERPVRGCVHGQGDVSPDVLQRGGDLVEWHLGYLPEERIAEVLGSVDLLVLPYQEASQSGVVLQAFAAGLPVVATPVGGLREQVEGLGGVVADGLDAAAVAQAIRRVLDDRALADALSERALATAADRGWARVAAPLLPLLGVPPR